MRLVKIHFKTSPSASGLKNPSGDYSISVQKGFEMSCKKLFPFALLVLLTFFSFSSLLRPGYFPMHDDMQAMRVLQMHKCLLDSQIPCRWVPDMGYGFGYPQFNYYAPLPYYLMDFFHVSGLSILDSVKVGFIVSVLLSCMGMYLLGRKLWGPAGGFLSSLFYVYAPYRALDMYVRGAVGEFWALAFLPLILWSVIKIFDKDKKALLWFSLSLAGLFTSHNITTLMFLPVIFLWIVFLFAKEWKLLKKDFRNTLFRLVLGFIWGVGFSAFFLLPAWFEKGYVHVETLIQGYFGYLAHFVSLGQLLFSAYWGFGASELGPYDELSLSVGLMHWVLPLFSLSLCYILGKKRRLTLLFFVVLAWLSLFMTHLRSIWLWEHLPFLTYLQFPWRFLSIATFASSCAVGSLTLLLTKDKKVLTFSLLVILALLFLVNVSYFRPKEWINIGDSQKFSGELWEKQLTISIFDYLPIYAEKPPAQKAKDKPGFISGNGRILTGTKGTNWQEWEVFVSSDKGILELQTYYFPNWQVLLDGKSVNINHDNKLGLIRVEIPGGQHFIQARLEDTFIRKVSNLISLMAFLAIPIFFMKLRVQK